MGVEGQELVTNLASDVAAPSLAPPARGLELVEAAPRVAARRLEYIDGLRALAALWVVFHHIIGERAKDKTKNRLHLQVIAAFADLGYVIHPDEALQ